MTDGKQKTARIFRFPHPEARGRQFVLNTLREAVAEIENGVMDPDTCVLLFTDDDKLKLSSTGLSELETTGILGLALARHATD